MKKTKWKNSNVYEYWQQQALLNEQTHIATFILHRNSHFFLFNNVTKSTVLRCKCVTLNNNKKVGVE